jgi:peptide/nickel transport system permease protein
MPGDPAYSLAVTYMQEWGISFEAAYKIAQQSLAWDTSKPLWERYIEFICNLIKGDLGKSVYYRESVSKIVAKSIPWTVFVGSISLLITYIIGIYLGSYAAWRRGKIADSVTFLFAIVFSCFPSFVTAVLILILFGVKLRLIPLGGAYAIGLKPSFTFEFVKSALHHAIGPILALSAENIAAYILGMRNSAVAVLQEDFVNFAVIRGLRNNTISKKYVRKPAILPLVTALSSSVGFLLGGATLAETVFRYPGMGYQFGVALGMKDYPLIVGLFTLQILAVLFAMFLVELIYPLIDPRARER